MAMLMIIIWGISALLLVLILAIDPSRSRHSWFELTRRGDDAAMRRESLIATILGLKRFIVGILLVLLVLIGLQQWQIWGVVSTLVFWVVAGGIARLKIVRSIAKNLYQRVEPWLLQTIERLPVISRLVETEFWRPPHHKLESVDELIALVESSGNVLSDDQRNIIRRGIDWHTMPVSAIMTPRSDIVSIKHSELLGPLVLDDLHRSGHGQFPVVKGSLDNIVGVLDVAQLLEINSHKHSETAEKAMNQRVLRIGSDETVQAALDLINKGRQHLLVVVDGDGQTVGILTLSDITGSLLR